MSAAPPDDRVESWKEIAAYLKRDVTTVQRWERRESMPVHRHLHDKLGSVYAFRSDLDAWMRSRNLRLSTGDAVQGEDAPARDEAGPTRRARPRILWLAPVSVVALGLVIWVLGMTSSRKLDPIAGARFQDVADFDGVEQSAGVSRDGRFVAFLSNHDGPMDVWVTQAGTGQFYNLTRGAFPELLNTSVRTVGFSPDGSLVTFWARGRDQRISTWAVPTLGGQPRPYLDGVAEFDWSNDGTRLVYHTAEPGDPMFVREAGSTAPDRRILVAPPGVHAHFPIWSPDQAFVYFVQGSVPDAMDIWRVRPAGGAAERITHHDARVSYPVMPDARTVLYLAADEHGAGPWLYAVDVDERVPRRVSTGVETYSSLSASADGRRLVAALGSPKHTFWRMRLPLPGERAPDEAAPARVPLTTGRAFSPRLGTGCLFYASSKAGGDAVWKLEAGTVTEIWEAPAARIAGGLAVAPDGRRVAFTIQREGRSFLCVVGTDGSEARVAAASLAPRGSPAWAPDGRSLTVAADDGVAPHLFAVPLDGRPPTRLTTDYSADPASAPDGRFIVYSAADVGTTFPLRAVRPDGSAYTLPQAVLSRGARRVRFLPGQHALVVMRGGLQHKDLWLIDLETGAERPLVRLPRDFDLRDFDLSPDGRELVLDRLDEQSDLVLIDLKSR